LSALYKSEPGAKALAEQAKAVLAFPDIAKGGFVVAGQYGLQLSWFRSGQ